MSNPNPRQKPGRARSERERSGRWPYVALLACIVLVCGYTGNALPVLAPRLPEYYGIAVDRLGLLFAVPLLASTISYAVVGPASERWGAKRMLLVASLGIAVAYGLCGVGTRAAVFGTGVLLTGLFGAAIAVCFPSYLARLHPHSNRRALSFSLTASAVPWVIFPPFVGRLMTGFPNQFARVVHVPFLFGAVLLVVGAMLFRHAPSDAPGSRAAPERRPSIKEGFALLRRPSVWLIVLLGVMHGSSDGVFGTWFPIYAARQFGGALRHPGDVIALCGLAYVVSRSALAAVPDGRAQRLLLIVPGLLGGLILLACIWLNNPRVMFWGYPLAAFAWSCEYPALLSEAWRRAPGHFATLLSVMIIAMQLVSAGLTALMGIVVGAMSAAPPTAPWWQRDLRLAVTIFPLGLILFAVTAAVSGLGRRPTSER